MSPSALCIARVDHLGDQGKAEDDKQGSDNWKHGYSPFAGFTPMGYRAKRARM